MTNPLINSIIVFYSSIPTTSFLPHQKSSIRTQVTALQTFIKAARTVIPTSRKAEPHLNWQLHVHVRAIATITTATAYTPFLALPPCYHVSNLPNARGHFFYYQIWSVTDKQTENHSLYKLLGGKPRQRDFSQPVIIRDQIYGQYNFTFILPHQKTSIRTKFVDDHKVEKPP